jgi:hypothetical protein
METRAILLLAAGWLAASSDAAVAQIPSSPRELGMGGAYLAVARGHDAVFLAPGNFGLPDAPRWSFGFPQAAVGGTLLGLRFADLPDLGDFDHLSAARQDELLSAIPAGGTEGRFHLRAPLATFSSGGMALGVAFNSAGRHTLSRDLTELLVEGYQEGRTDYSVGDTFGERATYWDFAAGYGRTYGSLALGATTHYVRGRNLVRSRLFEPRVDLEAHDVQVDFVGVLARGGSGFAVDLGAAYASSRTVTFSAALSNAFSRMTWSDELRARTLTLDRDLLENATARDVLNRYEASEEPLEGGVPLRVYETAEGLYDEAYFPAVVRFGVGWQPGSRTHVAADLHRKLSSGRLGDPWDRRLAIGVQQSLWIIGLRAGYALGS